MGKYNIEKGQSLIELIIGIAVTGVLVGGSTMAIALILRSNLEAKTNQTASFLASEYSDSISSISESNWLKIYCPPSGICPGLAKGADSKFYLSLLGPSYSIVSGTTSTIIEGKVFTRYFYIENVSRDSCGIGNISIDATSSCVNGPGAFGVSNDPSTQKITVKVDWEGGRSVSKVKYLFRTRNFSSIQSDWSAGGGQSGIITSFNNSFDSSNNINYSLMLGSMKMQNYQSAANLISSIFDSQISGGVAINSIMWKGIQPLGTDVKFQIASSNSPNGPWNYLGPDGSGTSYYSPGGANLSSPINLAYHNNQRYFRYKIFLYSDIAQTTGPQVDDVVINWSP